MIRLILTDPSNEEQVLAFVDDTVTIGRSPDNLICLKDRSVSKYHGRVRLTEEGFLYEDLNSTNGSIMCRDGELISVPGPEAKAVILLPGNVIQISPYSLRLDVEEPLLTDAEEKKEITVVLARPVMDPTELQADVVGADSRVADQFLQLVRETGGLLRSESKLMTLICEFVFQAFPRATHMFMVVRDPDDGRLRPLLAQSRQGQAPDEPLSSTIVNRVLSEGVSLLFSHVQANMSAAESVAATHIETAICAPLRGLDNPFGVIQLDIRSPGTGVFSQEELDLLTLFACHIGLIVDNLRLYQEQRRALQSTINALVHSLTLKDPETASHSERVQAISLLIGNEMGLNEEELEVLAVASVLHDTGKHASRSELLHKPGRLTPGEQQEIAQHATYTQGVLDRIRYPRHLKSVPLIAAYHHEKMNGSGTYGITGDQIPMQARIIAVADVFDALASPRSYKDPKPLPEVLSILNKDRDEQWDGGVLDVVNQIGPKIAMSVYGMDFPLASEAEIDTEVRWNWDEAA